MEISPFISIAYDTSKSAISVPQLTSTDTFATFGAEQTLTNKTLTSPIIASLRNASSNGLITILSSATATTLATLELAEAFTGVKTLTSPVLTDGTHNLTMPTLTADKVIVTADDLSNADRNIKNLLGNRIDYLANWINVGNLSILDTVLSGYNQNNFGTKFRGYNRFCYKRHFLVMENKNMARSSFFIFGFYLDFCHTNNNLLPYTA